MDRVFFQEFAREWIAGGIKSHQFSTTLSAPRSLKKLGRNGDEAKRWDLRDLGVNKGTKGLTPSQFRMVYYRPTWTSVAHFTSKQSMQVVSNVGHDFVRQQRSNFQEWLLFARFFFRTRRRSCKWAMCFWCQPCDATDSGGIDALSMI